MPRWMRCCWAHMGRAAWTSATKSWSACCRTRPGRVPRRREVRDMCTGNDKVDGNSLESIMIWPEQQSEFASWPERVGELGESGSKYGKWRERGRVFGNTEQEGAENWTGLGREGKSRILKKNSSRPHATRPCTSRLSREWGRSDCLKCILPRTFLGEPCDYFKGRQWTYQTCTEFGFYQTTDSDQQPFGKHFSLK